MFLRKEEKQVIGNTFSMVPYCKDCDSQDIETIYKCKKCGSTNIKEPTYSMLADDNDEKNKKYDVINQTRYMYKCDKCGKEFEGLENPVKEISEVYGEFVPYKDEEYGTNFYFIEGDLCRDCLWKICDRLNAEMNAICSEEHVGHVVKMLNYSDTD